LPRVLQRFSEPKLNDLDPSNMNFLSPVRPAGRGLRRKPHCQGRAKRMHHEAALAIVGLPYGPTY
jgi:hypothetical protein